MMNQKKGDTVILCGFTGIKLGVFEVTAASKKTLTLTKANGDELIFDRKTGKQVNVEEGKEKYGNKIVEDDGSYVAPTRTGKKKADKKPAKKQSEPVVEDDEDEDEEEPKPTGKKDGKKSAASTGKKPSKKQPVVEDDDEDEEDDEDDDDDFEEVDD